MFVSGGRRLSGNCDPVVSHAGIRAGLSQHNRNYTSHNSRCNSCSSIPNIIKHYSLLLTVDIEI